MNSLFNASSINKGAESMQKKMKIFLAIGIVSLISGIVMAVVHITAVIIPALLASIGGAMIGVYISTKGGTLVLDEMVKRINALSAYYSWIATFYCIVILSIIQFFYRDALKDWFLWIIMMVMSLSFILFRYFLLRRGKTE
jgi:hypothetical protein